MSGDEHQVYSFEILDAGECALVGMSGDEHQCAYPSPKSFAAFPQSLDYLSCRRKGSAAPAHCWTSPYPVADVHSPTPFLTVFLRCTHCTYCVLTYAVTSCQISNESLSSFLHPLCTSITGFLPILLEI